MENPLMRRLALFVLLLCAVPVSAQITPPGGAGITVVDTGSNRLTTLVVTYNFAAFTANAVTQDITIGTVPKKFKVLWLVADVTQAFVCAAVCTTSTLSMTAGKTAGGNEYLASFDLDAAAATFGLSSAQGGTAFVTGAAVPVQGGDIPSWTAATTVQARFTSGTGNVGNGTVTNLNAGSVTFYLTGVALP
jgi:hypothetical protein